MHAQNTLNSTEQCGGRRRQAGEGGGKSQASPEPLIGVSVSSPATCYIAVSRMPCRQLCEALGRC